MEGLPDWPTNWLTSRLAGWLAGWLGDWLTFWPAGELSAPISLSLFTLFYVTFWFPLHTRSVKMGNLISWNNVLFFFATGVLNCKISVTSEFIYKNCNETMDVVVDSSRNVYLPLWENTSRSWNQSYGRICRVPPADALREKEKRLSRFLLINIFQTHE